MLLGSSYKPATDCMRPRGIKRMIPRHFKVMELVLAGHTINNIAEACDMSRQMVNIVMRSPLFQQELVSARERSGDVEIMTLDRNAIMSKAKLVLEEATLSAVNKQIELMNGADNESVQLKASVSILDRAYGKTGDDGPRVIKIEAVNATLIMSTIKELNYAQYKEQSTNKENANGSSIEGHVDVHEEVEG